MKIILSKNGWSDEPIQEPTNFDSWIKTGIAEDLSNLHKCNEYKKHIEKKIKKLQQKINQAPTGEK
tara:strand:- start:46 stop:243 length:198 start_codon:yes stop_codon:yes gene_type:complete